jgi:hypothetical protein
MPPDPAHQFNPAECGADFTYTMSLNAVKIVDSGKGMKAVADDLEAVLKKIEYWHQGPIAKYRITYLDTQGLEQDVEWDGKRARISPAGAT